MPAVLSAPWYVDDTVETHQYGGDAKGDVALKRCRGSLDEFYWINAKWKCMYGIYPDDDVPVELALNTSLVMGGGCYRQCCQYAINASGCCNLSVWQEIQWNHCDNTLRRQVARPVSGVRAPTGRPSRLRCVAFAAQF